MDEGPGIKAYNTVPLAVNEDGVRRTIKYREKNVFASLSNSQC